MSALSGYLMRVICAALICALVGAIGGGGNGLRKLTAGLFLSLTVLSPLADVDLPELDTHRIYSDAQAAVRSGERQATQAKNAIISQSLEAYIWNKAGELGLDLEIRVSLDEQGMPESVELTGTASPVERQNLSNWIARELGLGKEAQIWTTTHQSSE